MKKTSSFFSSTAFLACRQLLISSPLTISMHLPYSLFIFLFVLQAAGPLMIKLVGASDPDPLQDFCVADLTKDLYQNGYPCKDPASVTTNDFVFQGFKAPPQTNTTVGANAINGFAANFPGLNSLGISVVRLDFGKGGIILPHIHPRASEIVYVLHGSLYAGFVTTANKLFAKVIHAGEVMAFPRGLIHFQLNVGDGAAQGLAILNGQTPGFQIVPFSMFGSGIRDEVLQKTFLLDQPTITRLKATFSKGFVNSDSLLSSGVGFSW